MGEWGMDDHRYSKRITLSLLVLSGQVGEECKGHPSLCVVLETLRTFRRQHDITMLVSVSLTAPVLLDTRETPSRDRLL
ncbi:hypothetical protein DTO166G4_4363 [Paecilomyces variotii]|nr:hypothetical protein DTO166G4_4363 [Paecilomyces variotii]KAJ9241788.1 hypothetical protein DTO166G5_864 [Paecilomyces variotii]KAJ9258835.1 hypothetical protein DTO195F2_5073 [Paecilomyces variotii]KAJ9284395.1 hypothetical protein DTO021C3_8040 [Paecilomyces variotii]KAJ9302517.1 hypothetical protein DTO217A2_7323 [Paecilomyces variotii]